MWEKFREKKTTFTLLFILKKSHNSSICTTQKQIRRKKIVEKIQKEKHAAENNTTMIVGELNGRVGNDDIRIENALGREGENMKNDNGRRIIDLCMENDLIIGNTKFTHKDKHKFMGEERSWKEWSIINYLTHREIWSI